MLKIRYEEKMPLEYRRLVDGMLSKMDELNRLLKENVKVSKSNYTFIHQKKNLNTKHEIYENEFVYWLKLYCWSSDN